MTIKELFLKDYIILDGGMGTMLQAKGMETGTIPETLNILKRFCEQDSRVNVLYLDSNHGPGYARNKSIERAKGRYIAFCDSDDRWAPDKLERQIAFMDEKHTALSYTSYIICDDDDEEEGIVIALPDGYV